MKANRIAIDTQNHSLAGNQKAAPRRSRCSAPILLVACAMFATSCGSSSTKTSGVSKKASKLPPATVSASTQSSAVLSFSSTSYDFGQLVSGASVDQTINVSHSGDVAATFLSASGLNDGFNFKGGTYPGTGGTCGTSIFSACTLVMSFAPINVLAYNQTFMPTYSDGTASHTASTQLTGSSIWVVGQPDFTSNAAATTQTGLNNPRNVFSDGTRLYVSDRGSNRVLIWNTPPTAAHQAPDLVLGQPDFVSSTTNTGGLSAKSLQGQGGGIVVNNKLFQPDTYNHRVLIWNTLPTTNFQPADAVLGQSSMTGGSANGGGSPSSTSLNLPTAIYSDGTRLVVTDNGNNRILIWNSIPSGPTVPADHVLGQSDFSTKTVNFGGLSASSLSAPIGASWDANHFFVVDQNNHRILVWDSFPTTDNQAADHVIGQPDFVTNTSAVPATAASLARPGWAYPYGGKLYVADYNNNRVLRWDSVPTTNGAAATMVMGQPDFVTTTAGVGLNKFDHPESVRVFGGVMYIADRYNNRILAMPPPQ